MQSQPKLPFRIRQSSLETARCLFRFHKIHILPGHVEQESEPAERGTDFHAMAREYVDYLVASHQELDWSYSEEIVEGQQWNHEAVEIFRNWVRRTGINPSAIFATEYQVRLNSNLTPVDDLSADVMYSMDVDRLEVSGREATIIDYKSHWAAFEPTTIQSVIYPWMLFKVMPHLEKITFVLDFVRWGIKKSREYGREHLEQMDRYIRNQVARLADAVEQDEWPAAINSKCVYCRLECPLVTQGLTRQAIGQVGSQEEANLLAQQLYALLRSYQQTHALLKAYASANGPIDAGNNIRLGFSKRNKFTYDVRTVVRLNVEHGFDNLRSLVVSATELKKVAKDYPEFLTTARANAKDRSTTAFEFWNDIGDPLETEEENGE